MLAHRINWVWGYLIQVKNTDILVWHRGWTLANHCISCIIITPKLSSHMQTEGVEVIVTLIDQTFASCHDTTNGASCKIKIQVSWELNAYFNL